ncbi:MAG: hypothetical protein HY909_04360 [Deltaproteobacteria bacterium]|nr:hypothetical protein [Deltaproteobacteria bacterium]
MRACTSGLVLGLLGALWGCSVGGVGTEPPPVVRDSGAPPPPDAATDLGPEAPPTDPCLAFRDCASCSALASCGFCAATGVCVEGTAAGPTRAECPAGFWRHQTCAAPVEPPPDVATDTAASCGTSARCEDCAARSGCGWCRTASACLAGTATGSTDGRCMGDTWAWTTGMCMGPTDGGLDTGTADTTPPPPDTAVADAGPCMANSCGTCTPMGSCGWCRTAGRCRMGTSSGPDDRSCPGTDWAWVPSACIAPPDAGPDATPDVPMVDPCLSNSGCADCASRLGCGWCRGINRCVTGTTSGPARGECSGEAWNFFTSSCPPPPDPCAMLTACDRCAANSACGWCRASNRCLAGTATGPTGGMCASGDWIRDAGACRTAPDPCNLLPTCLTCTAFPAGCGFCRASNRCIGGTSSGPTRESCPSGQWVWSPFTC